MNMSKISLFAGLFLAPVLYLSPSLLQSQDAPADAPEKDWLEFYYENPTPEQFVTRIKDWSGDGTLDNEHARPALIAFISQLIRQSISHSVGQLPVRTF